MFNTEKYVIGEPAPKWINDICSTGLVRFIRNDENVLQEVIVNTPTGVKRAVVGDVILKLKSGLAIVPGDKAETYKLKGKGGKKV